MLLINAEDDPIAVKQNFLDWQHLTEYKCHKTIFVMTKVGSHCSFLEGLFMDSWSEKAVFEFFEVVLSQ